ncbi:hypothetical protein P154DRAFT_559719 [Amniculicola lignicola CBS 123094]|uniref:CCHC-type domain-containing protein n=1 Tax=Amniculicola lignicola CBS 123094 TaxID=1392246 RepID=A0A6A5WYN6_9PLEO|nr:hypothetical protein P154DRAFT_559719 [Amniculicola lignicola CBS 123094]
MGKNKNRGGGGGRGGRGGGGGGGGGGNNQNRNAVQKNGSKKGITCNNCNKKGHLAKDCRSSNQKNNNNNNNNNNHQKGNKNERSNTLCLRCGYSGHETKNCTAKELPGELWCECGCPYHKSSSQCAWGQDPFARERDQKTATAQICQWCKDSGDGMHTFETCTESKQFRNQLFNKIEREYDSAFSWCWHCGAKDHRTSGCKNERGTIGRAEWTTKVNNIIREWVDKDFSQPSFLTGDVNMGEGHAQIPPVSADIPWCVLCETFNHSTRRRQDRDCDMTKYERNCPVEFRGVAVDAKQPYMPSSVSVPNYGTPFGASHYLPPGSTTGGTIRVSCTNPACGAHLTFPRACPEMGMTLICRSCHMPNQHPTAGYKDPQTELVKTVLEGIKSVTSFGREEEKRKEAWEKRKNDYKHRPSSVLPPTIAGYWPDQQPRYVDCGARRPSTGEPLFHPGNNFNYPGNHQLYFPAIRVQLMPEDLKIQDDMTAPINFSVKGLEYMCMGCRATAIVVDGEKDVVMLDTDAANAAGCGMGQIKFWGTGSEGWFGIAVPYETSRIRLWIG